MAKYWNDISDAAPDTDFIIYNIPQLAGVALSVPLLREMMKNPRVIGVKNSSMPVQDIQMWRDEGAIVFNGPDEQFVSGLAAGAIGGIGGTYAAMPELYLKARELFCAGELEKARQVQNECCRIIYKMCTAHSLGKALSTAPPRNITHRRNTSSGCEKVDESLKNAPNFAFVIQFRKFDA